MGARKKKVARRVRTSLTHFEVRRGGVLRLRLAIADDAMPRVGDEVGALLRKIEPGAVATRTIMPEQVEAEAGVSSAVPAAIVVTSAAEPSDFVISPQHDPEDVVYHATLRERLTELLSSLCDDSLADALKIAREVSARRAEGGN